MGFAPATKLLMERVYLVVTPILLAIGLYVLWKQGKQVEAILLGIIGALAIFYYWIKFFKTPNTNAGDMWPPFVSTCPDYLTLVSPQATGDADAVCIDFVGVAIKTPQSTNPLVVSSPNKMPKSSDSDFESKVFRLQGVTANADDATAVICKNVTARGLTWAHICDAP